MKSKLLTFLFIAVLIPLSLSHAFTPEELKTADKLYTEHSYQLALGKYEIMVNDPKLVSEDLHREVQFKWADCVVKAKDESKKEEALKVLNELIASEDHDRWWAEANETLATAMLQENAWDNQEKIAQYLNDARDFWAGSSELEMARDKFISLSFTLADFITSHWGWAGLHRGSGHKGSTIQPEAQGGTIKELFEQVLKVAKTDTDKARAHFGLGMVVALTYYGEIKAKDEAILHFNTVIKDFPKSEWADDAYYQLANYYRNRNDFVKTLEIYQQFLKNFKVGESQWFDEATRQVEEITKPAVNVYVSNVFTPDSEIQFGLNWRNVKQATVQFYKVDLTKVLGLYSEDNKLKGYENYQDLLKHLLTTHGHFTWGPSALSIDLTLKDEGKHIQYSEQKGLAEWRKTGDDKEIDPSQGILPVGAYMMLVNAKGAETAYELVFVSNLGIVHKIAKDKVLFFAFDALTGKPKGQTKIKYMNRYYDIKNNWEWEEGQGLTNEQGILTIDLTNPKRHDQSQDQWFVVANHEDHQTMVQNYYYGSNRGSNTIGELKLYAYSDRPAYRPNETVSFKGIVRQDEKGVFVSPAGRTVVIRITDAQGTQVKEAKHVLNDYGAFDDTLVLDDKSVLGEYRITVTYENSYSFGQSALFRLEEYKLPEYKVTIKPSSKNKTGETTTFRVGEPVTVDVDTQYYFGGPVSKAEVEYLVYQSPLYPTYYPSRPYPWYYEDMWGRNNFYQGQGQLIKTEKITTDKEGKATFTFDTPKDANNDWQYHVEVRVVDQSRREIRASQDIKVTRNAFFAYLEPKQHLYRPGDKAQITIKTLTANDEPMVVDGKVSVMRNWWKDPIPMRADKSVVDGERGVVQPGHYDGQEIFSKFVKTNAQGEAVFEFEPHEDGYYVVEFTGFDNGREVKGNTMVFVCTTSSQQIGYQYSGLQIIPEKDTYKQGETARLMIVADRPDTWVLLTSEAEDIYDAQVLHLEGSVKLVEVPVGENFVPNVFFHVLSADHYQMKMNNIQIIVPPEEKFLNVTIRSDKLEYQPQEEGTFDILVTDKDGKPVGAELSLGITDAAVYYIQEELMPDIRQFFYGEKRPMAVGTQTSFNNRPYLRLVRGLKNELISEEEQIRRRAGQDEGMVHATGNSEVDGEFSSSGDRRYSQQNGAKNKLSKSLASPARSLQAAVVGNTKEASKKREMSDSLREDSNYDSDSPTAPLAEAQLRSDFRSTVIWQPSIITDAEGKATVKVRFPDSLTTWRATARAITPATQIGNIIHEVKSKKDLMIRLQAPRFFTERDLVNVSALIDNMTDEAVTATPSIKTEGIDVTGLYVEGKFVKGEMKGNVEVPAHGQVRVDWGVHAAKAGLAKVTVTVQSKLLADAMTRSIPIIPHGIEKFLAQSLVLKGNSDAQETKEFTITIPKERIKESTSLTLSLSPSLAGNLLDALPYLAGYPYGCVEQTMSRFLPAVIVAETMKGLGLTEQEVAAYMTTVMNPTWYPAGVPGQGVPTLDKLHDMTKDGLKRLYDFQHGDGGWGWWKTGDSDRYMSAYVVWGLALARQAGIDVPEKMIAVGSNYLRFQLVEEENSPDMLAWMLHALAQAKSTSELEDKQRERLWAMRDQLNPYSRALFALSEHLRGNQERALTLARNLANGVSEDKDNGTVHWGEGGINYHWSEGSVEGTAFVIKALSNIDPQSAYLEPAVKWMTLNRRGARWTNTRDTAIAVLGLTDYLKASHELAPDYSYQVSVNGRSVREAQVNAQNVLSFQRFIELSPDALKDGANQVKVTFKGKGALYVAAFMKYFTLEEGISKAGNEIFVERKYYKEATKETLMKGYNKDWTLIKEGETLKSGQRVRVDVIMEAKNNYEYLISEDYKPAGLEAVELKSGEGYAIALDSKGRETDNRIPLYQEFRDQKAAFFISKLKQGKYIIRYDLRAEVPGEFHAMPNQAHAMYVPEIRANSDEMSLKVED